MGIGTVMGIVILMRAFFGTPYGVNPDGLVEPVILPTGQLRADARGPILDTWSYPDFVDVRDGARGVDIAGWAFGESMLRLPKGGGAGAGVTMRASAALRASDSPSSRQAAAMASSSARPAARDRA